MASEVAGTVAGTVAAAGACLLATPYLARLTLSVPDRERRDWWRGSTASRRRTTLTAAVGLVVGALAGAVTGLSLALIPFVLLALVGTALVVIDQEHHRLPNRLVFVLAVAAPVLALAITAHDGDWTRLGRAALAAAVVFAVLFAPRLVTPASFGYGDVKLGGVLGGYLGWYGWVPVFYGVFAGFVLCGAIGVVLMAARRADRKTHIPFGPSLLVGSLVVLVLSNG